LEFHRNDCGILVKLNKTVLFQWSATLVSTRNSGLTCLTSFLEHLLVSVVRPNAVASFLTSGCSIDLPNEDNVPKCLNSTAIYDNQPTITFLYSSSLPSPSLLILLDLHCLMFTIIRKMCRFSSLSSIKKLIIST